MSTLRFSILEISIGFGWLCGCPIHWVYTFCLMPVKTAVPPFWWCVAISVFYRIKVKVIQMGFIILLATNPVFPESPLPYWWLPAFPFCGRQTDLQLKFTLAIPGYILFDEFPPYWKTRIILWKSPDTMQMIWQQNPRIDIERMIFLCSQNCPFQRFAKFPVTKYMSSLKSNNRKEPGSTRGLIATIIRHASMMHQKTSQWISHHSRFM